HIRGWDNVPLAEHLRKKFKVRVFLENNIRSMALAELWFGKRGLRNLVCLGIRTGIGAGIVTEGKLLHGNDNLASQIRNWSCAVKRFEMLTTDSSGREWCCEVIRPLEEIASIPSIISAVGTPTKNRSSYVLRSNPTITFPDIIRAAKMG